MNKDIRIDDVVQVNPDLNGNFGGCFGVVTDVRSWGVMIMIPIPDSGGIKQSFLRCDWDEFEAVGKTVWRFSDES